MPTLRDALEAALVEDPDDLATHRAYADYLQEQGDPRGEFIQVQLALENTEWTAEQYQRLQARERKLLAEHGRAWLGVLADELLKPADNKPLPSGWRVVPRYDIHFARGWLNGILVRLPNHWWEPQLGELLCVAPEARLLRELIVEHEDGLLAKLVDSPFLTNLRLFQLGTGQEEYFPSLHDGGVADVANFVSRLPRIEKLRLLMAEYDPSQLFGLSNLTNLRTLQVYYLNRPHPLEKLAGNSALGALTHLLLYPHPSEQPRIDLGGVRAVLQSPHLRSLTHLQVRRSDLGDVGCTEIVTSGILKRLQTLDLGHGEITDVGARILADCPDLGRLRYLAIDRNGLTQTGIDALRRVLGDKLRADNQQTVEELTQRHYLAEDDLDEGDFGV